MNTVRRILSVYNKIEEIALAVMIVSSVIILFANVVLRKLFNGAVYGADELARVLFIWMSWLGISIGERESEHIKIDILTSKLSGFPEKVLHIISNIITLIILIILLRYGMAIVTQYYNLGNSTAMYHIPQWVVSFSVPFSCGVMGIRVLFKFIEIFTTGSSDVKEEGSNV